MKVCVIASTSHLEQFDAYNDFYLVESIFCEEDEQYKEFMKNSTKMKILDNSCKFKQPLSGLKLLELAQEMEANYVIAPDLIRDPRNSLRVSLDWLSKYQGKLKEDGIGCEVVIHAVNAEMFEDNVLRVVKSGLPVNIIGLPYEKHWTWEVKGLTDFHEGLDRVLLARRVSEIIRDAELDIEIHLLGFNNLCEGAAKYTCCAEYWDTSIPFRAHKYTDITPHRKLSLDYKLGTKEEIDRTERNINIFLNAAKKYSELEDDFLQGRPKNERRGES